MCVLAPSAALARAPNAAGVEAQHEGALRNVLNEVVRAPPSEQPDELSRRMQNLSSIRSSSNTTVQCRTPPETANKMEKIEGKKKHVQALPRGGGVESNRGGRRNGLGINYCKKMFLTAVRRGFRRSSYLQAGVA